ncbi:hypothetical protein [Bradyrhizobium diazoefficiens]|uniref:hypothetical protein n=1 Tax=Bradyrhizobium TaxID=374 RepID=UPI00178C5050|nr:hypothetical protein [Bradyrhizobium diazoefficiens]WLA73199.1 hypothetical protein QIH77_41550 [Bradyrhizobium diazoefficiens]
MKAILFCNIGWMSRYEGLAGKPDKIVGGGKFVAENETGLEVCNFLSCRDGYIYGHVETIQGEKDRQIQIEAFGGAGEYADDVDVVWTATDPEEGGRRVIGWYRAARVFRKRQKFSTIPSRQHAKDEIDNYRISTLTENAFRLNLEDRTLVMGRGRGWMGQTPWWTPTSGSSPEVLEFVRRTRLLLGRHSRLSRGGASQSSPGRNSPGASRDPYQRYVEAYEVEISPRHDKLQGSFERYLARAGATQVTPNVASVDLRYNDATRGLTFVEIKPCDKASARYAIRTAIGQLLDYRQRANPDVSLLIVLEAAPSHEDRSLATQNGFGVAYPLRGTFEVLWPTPS